MRSSYSAVRCAGCTGGWWLGRLVPVQAPRARLFPDVRVSLIPHARLLLISCRHLGAELRAKWLPTLKAGWMLWPAAHALNFALVPTQHRILYINVVSVAGTYVLSRAAAGDFSGKKTREHSPSPTEVVFDGVSVKLE